MPRPLSARLGGSYPTAVALALLALSPFIVLSTAGQLIQPRLLADLHTSMFGLQLTDAMSNAGYAFGAVLAADLVQRMPARRLYLGCELGFLVGSLVCLLARNQPLFLLGRVVQGLATGMLLVAALPPLVTRFGAGKLPLTAAVVNLGLFGMVTVGPLVGGVAASGSHWRVLFAAAAAVALVAVLLAVLGFAGGEQASPGMSFDVTGVPVALAATVLPFLGVTWAVRAGFSAVGFWLPVAAGVAALVALLVLQYRRDDAVMPLRLIAHTLPVTGISTAMLAGAGVTALVELSVVYLLKVRELAPVTAGIVMTTQVAGVVIAAALFARVLRTRWLPALALTGLGVVAVAGVLLLLLAPGRSVPLIAVAGFLIGFGAGAGVSPALFMAGLSAPSSRLGPTFGLVELLRAEAAYLVAPVVLQLAMDRHDLGGGLRLAAGIVVVLCAAGGALTLAVLLLGGARPHRPDLERWLDGEEPAFDSPPLAGAVRS